MDDEGDDEKDQSDVEDDLSDRCGRRGDTAKAENCGDDSGDEKYECPPEHNCPRVWVRR